MSCSSLPLLHSNHKFVNFDTIPAATCLLLLLTFFSPLSIARQRNFCGRKCGVAKTPFLFPASSPFRFHSCHLPTVPPSLPLSLLPRPTMCSPGAVTTGSPAANASAAVEWPPIGNLRNSTHKLRFCRAEAACACARRSSLAGPPASVPGALPSESARPRARVRGTCQRRRRRRTWRGCARRRPAARRPRA